MDSSTHPIEREELMAYLDGELPVERASTVAAHLEQCVECRALSAELRVVSERLTAWQVEPAPARLSAGVEKAIQEFVAKAQKTSAGPAAPLPRRERVARWVFALAGTGALVALIVAVSIPTLLRSRMAGKYHGPAGSVQTSEYRDTANPALTRPDKDKLQANAEVGGRVSGMAQESTPQPAGPMIIRTASLVLVTKDFDKTRAELEAIVSQHHGYNAQLTVNGQAGSGRALAATFRVPSDQLDAVLAEAKKLGRVERESQGGDEVTQQYVDLSARLGNARKTEQRLIEVLQQRTGKVGDILAVEREIARVREDIERMDAELKSLQNRVSFATLQVELREDYKAELEVAPPSTGTQLSNAFVEGYHTLAASLLALVFFLLTYGPLLLFWGLILFWPARSAWRRVRATLVTK